MGCFQSRLDKRGDQAGDFNVAGLAFLGGNASEVFDNFPVDRVLAAYNKHLNKTTEPAELIGAEAGLVATNEEQVKAIYTAVVEEVGKELKALEEKVGSDPKGQFYAGKYKAEDAIAQLKAVLEYLKTKSGLDVPAAAPEAAPAGDAAAAGEPAAAEGEGAQNEGGEEGAAADENADAAAIDPPVPADTNMEKTAPTDPNVYEGIDDHEGWANFGGALLRQAITNESFFDLLRSHALRSEFNVDKFTPSGLTGACALLSALADKAETAEKDYWLSGWVTQEYLDSLNDAVAGGSHIHFPWLVAGWNTKEQALADLHFPEPQKKENYVQVAFNVTKAKAFDFAKIRVISHRLRGKVTAGEKSDETFVFNLVAEDLPSLTVAAWEAAKTGAAAVAAATPVAAAPEAAPAEGEQPPAADAAPAEGEPAAAE